MNKIENVVDWIAIAKKYRILVGHDESDDNVSVKSSPDKSGDADGDENAPVANNINALPI